MRGATRIPLTAIQAMSIERAGFGMKGIRFSVAGGTIAQAATALGSHKDLAQDPYALTFKSKAEADFAALIERIEAAQVGA
jgi:hypothetical protein